MPILLWPFLQVVGTIVGVVSYAPSAYRWGKRQLFGPPPKPREELLKDKEDK